MINDLNNTLEEVFRKHKSMSIYNRSTNRNNLQYKIDINDITLDQLKTFRKNVSLLNYLDILITKEITIKKVTTIE